MEIAPHLRASGATTYAWSSNGGTTFSAPIATTDSVVSVAGAYQVVGFNGNGCTDTSSIVNIIITPPPTLDLGNDTTICFSPGDSLDLTAARIDTFTYTWFGATSFFRQLTDTSIRIAAGVSNGGLYGVNVTDTITGCSNSIAVQVGFDPQPVVNLGPDTTACGDSLTLRTDRKLNETYVWSALVGAFTQISDTSIRVISGRYQLQATTTANSCTSSDIINVTLNPLPVANLGNDTVLCGDSLDIVVDKVDTLTYAWSAASGSPAFVQLSDTSIRVASGTYSLTVTDIITGCISQPDSITVSISPLPVVSLGPDTLGCGDSLTIGATAQPTGQTYSWSALGGTPAFTSIGIDSIRVIAGAYVLTTTTDSSSCSASDTIIVNLNPLPVANLGNDTVLCGDSLDIVVDKVDTLTYAWSAAAGSPAFVQLSDTSIRVASGTYSLTVTDIITGCISHARQHHR